MDALRDVLDIDLGIDLAEIGFYRQVTKIPQKHTHKLIECVNNSIKCYSSKMQEAIADDSAEQFEFNDISFLIDSKITEFILYSLLVVYCYSVLERNRSLILEKMRLDREDLYRIKDVDKCLERIDISHRNIQRYGTMKNFLDANNAVKHGRKISSAEIQNKGETYNADTLKTLYSRYNELELYLEDLYRKVEEYCIRNKSSKLWKL